MKKILRVSFIPLLCCALLIAAAIGGNASSHRQENYRQERMIAPDSEIPEFPECPDCSRKPKITKIPYLKDSEKENSLEKIPVSYRDI